MEKVSRRKFVATAAVAGSAAVLRPPAFGFEHQSGELSCQFPGMTYIER